MCPCLPVNLSLFFFSLFECLFSLAMLPEPIYLDLSQCGRKSFESDESERKKNNKTKKKKRSDWAKHARGYIFLLNARNQCVFNTVLSKPISVLVFVSDKKIHSFFVSIHLSLTHSTHTPSFDVRCHFYREKIFRVSAHGWVSFYPFLFADPELDISAFHISRWAQVSVELKKFGLSFHS